ncbi:MAG: YbaB/EbfC family nucleoid-associated protein [Verrucomicrobia bacterium]|nr:YbaB/EbfC family nucleoid-associated protein [Verrucomicrobiota bacterium]
MGSGFSKMQKQARQMQEQLQKMQEEMKNSSFTGVSGSGLVTVVVNGEKNLKKITIKPECVDPNDVEGLEDLILAAFTDAAKKAEAESSNGLGLPEGFSLPF